MKSGGALVMITDGDKGGGGARNKSFVLGPLKLCGHSY